MKHPVFSNAPFFLLDLYEQELGFCDKIQDYSCKSLKDQDILFKRVNVTWSNTAQKFNAWAQQDKYHGTLQHHTDTLQYILQVT